jgi:hypothetical protein
VMKYDWVDKGSETAATKCRLLSRAGKGASAWVAAPQLSALPRSALHFPTWSTKDQAPPHTAARTPCQPPRLPAMRFAVDWHFSHNTAISHNTASRRGRIRSCTCCCPGLQLQ